MIWGFASQPDAGKLRIDSTDCGHVVVQVDSDRGSTKLRAVVRTVIEELPTTLEVPITTDFTIFVQLDYEGLHLIWFKCGSLDHKANDCTGGKRAEEIALKETDKGKKGASSDDTSSATGLQEGGTTVATGSKSPQKTVPRLTRLQGEAVLEGCNLWTGESSKQSAPG
ncbi:hypothetical protein R1sor_016325 [Riccia sorocarpa]|uniref:Zinc knuckle CX2CX4HX4C domain-containing protein n=1 Tax=Riccia sorocarpa TaxID=122646 RepID=A0ABD3HGI8_9MARC